MKKRYLRNDHHADESLINLTPLIDVVFVVLIAFILIAPLLEVDRVNLANASPSTCKDLPQKSHLAIYVHADNTIWINNQQTQNRELLELLKEKQRTSPSIIPQIFHDAKASFGTYQNLKTSLEKAGFKEMDIILKPETAHE